MTTEKRHIDTSSATGGWKAELAYGLSLAFVCLFAYTAYHKAADFDPFVRAIMHTPYLGGFARPVAWGVLGAEAAVSLLLIWPGTNRAGLWGALGLMSAFTLYIASMLLFAANLPCTCGGAIEKFTWTQHLLFNLGFIALATGLLLHHNDQLTLIFNTMNILGSKIKKAIFGMMVACVMIGSLSAFEKPTANLDDVLSLLHFGCLEQYRQLGTRRRRLSSLFIREHPLPCPDR